MISKQRMDAQMLLQNMDGIIETLKECDYSFEVYCTVTNPFDPTTEFIDHSTYRMALDDCTPEKVDVKISTIISHLDNKISTLTEERDAYREALKRIRDENFFGIEVAEDLARTTLEKYKKLEED